MNLKLSTNQSLQSFSNFSSVKEFHDHMEQWTSDYRKKFTRGEYVGLKMLFQFSTHIPGVCREEMATFLEGIHKSHDQGISRATFKRMLGKAKSIGILTVYATADEKCSQSGNLYVFNPYPFNKIKLEEY